MTMVTKIWKKWQALGKLMGDFIGRLVMTVFYFTIAAPFGLAVRILSDPLALKRGEPRWEPRETAPPTLEDAKRSF